MESCWITDSMLFASSLLRWLNKLERARLNWEADLPNAIGAGWIPDPSDTALGTSNMTALHIFSSLLTQGCGNEDAWVETFSLAYSNASWNWKHITYQESAPLVVTGNTDQVTVVEVTFGEVYGQYLRILPLSWHNHVGLPFGIVGCPRRNGCNVNSHLCMPPLPTTDLTKPIIKPR
ncbi:retinoschisin-like [Acanthaster planci]|uniref:Retinoschisin-like n=1 Tax=Acanthaster planci TaxID=133434 RepID=A0A8B7ZC83_ACAPL|nr:retinoschisin-like [Acanthaster planci]